MANLFTSLEGNVLKGGVRFTVAKGLFPMEAVYQAAFIFVDDYYVYLDRDDRQDVVVELRPKTPQVTLERAQGEFRNELVHQVVRRLINKQSGNLRELIVGRALFGALGDQNLPVLGPGSRKDQGEAAPDATDETLRAEQEELDRLLAEIESDFSGEGDDIATPWDDKFGGNDKNNA